MSHINNKKTNIVVNKQQKDTGNTIDHFPIVPDEANNIKIRPYQVEYNLHMNMVKNEISTDKPNIDKITYHLDTASFFQNKAYKILGMERKRTGSDQLT